MRMAVGHVSEPSMPTLVLCSLADQFAVYHVAKRGEQPVNVARGALPRDTADEEAARSRLPASSTLASIC